MYDLYGWKYYILSKLRRKAQKEEMRAVNKDLTVGKPQKVLWAFCLPLFGSIIFQQLYNIADSLVAGKFIGENALAAVGNSYEITLIFIAFAFGCNIGCSVVVSRYFGAKQYADMKTAVHTTLIFSGAVCALLMALGLIFQRPLLRLIQTPEDVLVDSSLYLDIYIWGLPFVFFYNISEGIFSAMGDSRTPFIFLACSSLSNIAMDILFVKAFHMGVAGVAWATFLCQGVSCVLALLLMLRCLSKIKTEDGRARLFSDRILGEIVRIALPSTLQQSFISVGNIVIQSVVNGFGASVMAGYSAAIKLNNLVITSFTTLGNGISNYTGQNLGAGKPERVREGLKAGVAMVWLLCVPLAGLYLLCGEPLIRFFMNAPSALAVSSGMQLLRVVAPFYFVVSVKLVTDGVLRGAEKMRAFMVSTLTDLVLRVALAILLSRDMGTLGVWSAWPVGWCVATGLSLMFYLRSFRKQQAIA